MGRVQNAILDVLEFSGEAFQSNLVKAARSSRSRVSEVLSQLERDGLVQRIPIGKNFKVSLRSGLRKKDRRKKVHLRLGFPRAAEYPFLAKFKKLLDDMDMILDLQVYENGTDVARDLSMLRLDLGIAPVLTNFMYHSLGAPIRIVAPAGSGGASIILRKQCNGKKIHENESLKVVATKLSTMELLLRSYANKPSSAKIERTFYASSPAQMKYMITAGRVDAACIWEPYATVLEKQGFTRIIRYKELSEHICCVLAAGNHLKRTLTRKIVRIYKQSLHEFSKDPLHDLPVYGAITGLDAGLLKEVASEYTHPFELDAKLVSEQLELAGMQIPSPWSVRDAFTTDRISS